MHPLHRLPVAFPALMAAFVFGASPWLADAGAQNLRSGQMRAGGGMRASGGMRAGGGMRAPSALRATRPGAAMRTAGRPSGIAARPSMSQRPQVTRIGGGSRSSGGFSGASPSVRGAARSSSTRGTLIGGSNLYRREGSHGWHHNAPSKAVYRGPGFSNFSNCGTGVSFHSGFKNGFVGGSLCASPAVIPNPGWAWCGAPGWYGACWGYPVWNVDYYPWPYYSSGATYISTDAYAAEAYDEGLYLDWPAEDAAPLDSADLQAEALQRFRAEREAEAEQARRVDRDAGADAGRADREALVAESVARGDRAFEAGAYDVARDEYIRALVQAGDDAGVRIALGLAEYALGSYGDASATIRRALAGSTALARSTFDLRAAYGRPGDSQDHRVALEDHVTRHPGDADAVFLLGFVEYFSGRRADGARRLKDYLRMDGHDRGVLPFIEAAAFETGQAPAWDQ